MNRKLSLIILLLLLPALAGWIISNHRAAGIASGAQIAQMSTPSIAKVVDCRLFGRRGRHGKVSILSNAVAIKFQTNVGLANASTFTVDAPLAWDGSVGDTSTGYPFGVGGSLSVLYDLGASPPSVSKFEAAINPNNPDDVLTLEYSTTGTSWTPATGGSSSITNGSVVSITPVTARYWQFVYQWTPGGVASNATDARLYDGTGTLIGGPTTPVSHNYVMMY